MENLRTVILDLNKVLIYGSIANVTAPIVKMFTTKTKIAVNLTHFSPVSHFYTPLKR